MKKLLSLLLCLMLLCSAAAAETVLNGGENRNITIDPADLNDPIDGISPVTGRLLDDVMADQYRPGYVGQAVTGRYMPILVQIDNTEGGIGYNADSGKATGNRAHWGVEYTDVIYETPLYRSGDTRLTFLFSDIIPDEVGPCRSARLFHAWLREEWDCAFSFYGQQEYTATNVPEVFKQTGAEDKGVLFPGTVGSANPWKQYYDTYVKGKFTPMKPHHVTANVAAMMSLVPADFEAANHTWLFTDQELDGDEAETIYVKWGKEPYNSILEWDDDEEAYIRYMINGNQITEYKALRVGVNGDVSIPFANVIVQFTKMEWSRVDAPNPTVTGTGNADYFIGGVHIPGVWQRNSLSDRTVFYDADGEEIKLHRGRTLIIVMDYEYEGRSISFE